MAASVNKTFLLLAFDWNIFVKIIKVIQIVKINQDFAQMFSN